MKNFRRALLALTVGIIGVFALVVSGCVPEDGGGSTTTLPGDDGPTAVIVANGVSGDVSGMKPFRVDVDASQSADPAGEGLTYAWDFGSSVLAGPGVYSAESPSDTYNIVGSHTATRTVTDGNGASDSVSIIVTVDEVGVAH